MHVHANYNQTLATLGVGRDETQEMAARRAAEVRRRLAAADKLLSTDVEDVAFVKASDAVDAGPEGDTYSTSGGQQPADTDPEAPPGQGNLFSARA
jgi:hypothetical protein